MPIAGHSMAQELAGVHVDFDDLASSKISTRLSVPRWNSAIFITQSGTRLHHGLFARGQAAQLAHHCDHRRSWGSTSPRCRRRHLHTCVPLDQHRLYARRSRSSKSPAYSLFALVTGADKRKIPRRRRQAFLGELLALPERMKRIFACRRSC